MATSVALPTFQRENLLLRALRYVPGIVLLATIGYSGKLIERALNTYAKTHHIVFPDIEYVLWAIVLGLLISNVLTIPKTFEAGIATYEFWLKAGIVLLGSRFILGDVARLGGISLALVAIEISGSLALMTLLGRIFRLKPKLTTLLSVGSAICGVSAIIATQGAINSDEEDTSVAIAAILALGALALFTFPLIGHALHMTDATYGLWSGLAVDNTAEAIATGALYSDAAGRMAILAKTTRSAMLGFVVLGYALYWANKGQAEGVQNKALFLWNKFPKFVFGFLAISILASAHTFNKDQIGSLANLSRWAFLLSFAGVGLRTNFRRLTKQGLRPLAVGTIGEVLIAVLTLGLVLGASAVWHL